MCSGDAACCIMFAALRDLMAETREAGAKKVALKVKL
jgi:hypothetical protein